MKVEILSSYIEKRIQDTRTWEGESKAIRLVRGSPDRIADHDRQSAFMGDIETTASFLSADLGLPIFEKGRILANAYSVHARHNTDLAEHVRINPDYREVAEKSTKIAQGLKQAAKRLQKT